MWQLWIVDCLVYGFHKRTAPKTVRRPSKRALEIGESNETYSK